MAQLSIHQMCTINNTATLKWAWFEVLEVYEYKGADIIYGQKRTSPVWVPGRNLRYQEPAGPAAFPLFPEWTSSDIELLVKQLNSLPLRLDWEEGWPSFLHNERPLLTLEGIVTILGGQRGYRDDMIARTRKLVDLYHEWLKLEKTLPLWIVEKQAALKAQVTS